MSPTYFGAVADVQGLAGVAHGHGVPLVVDEAWGAHLAFGPSLPRHALACGADLVVSSTHKIIGSLTESAMLHLGGGGRLDEHVVDRAITLLESTSPSSLLCGSLDAARAFAARAAHACSRRRCGARRRAAGDRANPGARRAGRGSCRATGRARLRPAATRRRRAGHGRERLPVGAADARARHPSRAGRRERDRGGVRDGGDRDRQRRPPGRGARAGGDAASRRTRSRGPGARCRRPRGGRSR